MKATSRLLIRPFTLADIDHAFAWFGDPQVMRFTTGGSDRTRDDTRHRLTRYIEHQEQYGFSKWLIQERATGEAIGDAGLLILDALGPIPDLGFRFAKSHWGQGLATEVAGAWLHLAFNEFGLERVSAFAHVENLASLRVLEKVGFTRLERRDVMGMDSYTYRLMRSEFAPLRGDQPATCKWSRRARPFRDLVIEARGSFATLGGTRYAVENARLVLADQMAAPTRNVDTLTPSARAAIS